MKTPLLILTFALAWIFPAFGQDNAVISEFMASNLEAIEDEDGDASDWIEFYNPGDATAQLRDHFLTDDRRNLRKWRVPGNLSIPPNGYGLIFASGKDRGGLFASTFHTNFELTEDGEYLALVAPDGETILSEFASKYPKQRVGLSYGIAENASGGTELRYFETPTPEAANGTGREDLPPRVADTKFSVTRGFYDEPITVEITTATEGATIYYSVDGSDPDKGSVFIPGKRYTEPITIDSTTMLRARAFKDGLEPTNIDTHTYVYIDSVLEQADEQPGLPTRWNGTNADYGIDPDIVNDAAYRDEIRDAFLALPTLSIVTEEDNLWANDGLYLNTTQRASSGQGADFRFEFEVSAELLHPDGSKGFQIQAGLRAQGGASRNADRAPKHAMSLRFRRVYGEGSLDYPVIPSSPLQSYNSLHLRARYNNTWHHSNAGQRDRALYIRDQWARDSMVDMGTISGGHGDYAHVYLNGLYWGIFVLQERLDSSHYASYYGGRADSVDAVNGGRATDGNLTSYNAMRDAARSGDWEEIQERLDVDNYIDWHIIQRFGSNNDWKNDGNWKAAGGGPDDRLWRFYAWDTERILEGVTEGAPQPSQDPSAIFNRLDDIPEFTRRFGDRLQKHLFHGGALTPDRNIARFQRRATELEVAILAESARWGDYRRAGTPYERDDEWVTERDRVLNDYFPRRTEEVIEQYQNAGLYPSILGVDLNQHGGSVESGFEVKLSSEGFSLFTPGKIYYTTDGTDPIGPDDEVASTATEYGTPFALNESTTVKARGRSTRGEWSALTEVFFTVGASPASSANLATSEIMYHPGAPTAEESAAGHVSSDDFEYIELSNRSEETVDLANLTASEGIRFAFTAGPHAVLEPNETALLVRNEAAFRFRYGDAATINGIYEGNLDNNGETLTFTNATGETVTSVDYSDSGAWPQTADGAGFSLTLADSATDPNRGASWRPSTDVGGSPGSEDTGLNFGIVINEILTNSTAPDVDAIELLNTGTAAVDLSGWFLTDDPNTPQKFVIPDGTNLAPGAYVVFLEDNDNDPANNADLPAEFFGGAFGLSSRGDAVHLFSADAEGNLTGYNDGFSFGAAEEGKTFGRVVDSQGRIEYPTLAAASLGSANATPQVGDLVITEINYHSSQADDLGEFVELVNRSSQAISLDGWQISGIGYTFPADTQAAPGEILLVARSRADLETLYDIPADIRTLPDFTGRLDNDGERLTVERPGETYMDNGVEKTTSIAVDSVRYNDAEPWPTAADGLGGSLERTALEVYADEVTSWASGVNATPGIYAASPPPETFTFEDWKMLQFNAEQLGNESIVGLTADPDGDGLTNQFEYIFSRDPQSPEISPTLIAETVPTGVAIRYSQRVNIDSTLVLQSSDDLENWSDVEPMNVAIDLSTPGISKATITLPHEGFQRYARLAVKTP